jgi:hypothetical protein
MSGHSILDASGLEIKAEKEQSQDLFFWLMFTEWINS